VNKEKLHNKFNNIDKLLDETERLEQLNFDSLKELWVKQFLWKGYRKQLLKQSGNPLLSKEYETNLELLRDMEPNYGLGRFILDTNCFKQSLKKFVLDNNNNVVNALFDKLTKDYPDEKMKKLVLNQLKGLLNGACGMPIHQILRGTIENCLARQELESQGG